MIGALRRMGVASGLMLVVFVGALMACFTARAATTTYTYDANGRVTAVTYGAAATLGYAFDAAGNLVQVSSFAIITTALPAPVLGTAYSQTIATSGGTAPITFSVSGGALPSGLMLTTSSGLISGTPSAAGSYSFTITATDATGLQASQSYSSTTGAALAITTTTLPTPVLTRAYSQAIVASGGITPYSFSVSAGSLPAGLTLNATTGVISGTATTAGAYGFTIKATDTSGRNATQAYSGTIVTAPSITTATLPTPALSVAYSQSVVESGGLTPIVFSVSAGALPAGLTLNSASGLISGTATAPGAYGFTITVTDANGLTASQAYSGTIVSMPVITSTTLPTPVLTQAYSQTVGTSGGTPPLTFSVSVGTLPTGLSLTAASGLISGTPTASGAYSFTITVTDSNSFTASQAYSGTIAALPTITTTSLPTPHLAVAYSQTIATSGGAAPIAFSVSAGSLPAGLALTASSGLISGTPTATGAFSFTITATDANGLTASQAYSGTVNAVAPTITTGSLPTPALTVAYSQTIATSGGTAPITFTVSAGALPAGLSLGASTGVISGTATTAGAYSFTITATDSASRTGSKAYSGTIQAAPTITTTTLPTPVLTHTYTQTLATSGGTTPFTFSVSAGALPSGLSLSSTLGKISGTSTAAGSYSFTILVTDANGLTGSQAFSGTIASAPTITTATLPAPALTLPYSQTVNVSGGYAPITFTVSGGALPAGIALTASTGLISGTATTAHSYTFVIKATDANGLNDTQTYTGIVQALPTITTTTLATPVVGHAYSHTVMTSGGTAPITFSISAGALPAGLAINSTSGLISGTPTTSGAYSFTVTITDANGLTASQSYSGTIA